MKYKSELKRIDRIKMNLYDFINGIYSGLPLCCVLNFCRVDYFAVARAMVKEYGITMEEFGKINVNYVPCKKCFDRKHFVKMKNNGSICDFLSTKNLVPIKDKNGKLKIYDECLVEVRYKDKNEHSKNISET